MNDYIEPYITCDLILDSFHKVRSRLAIGEIEDLLKGKATPNNIIGALNQLMQDEFIKREIDHHWYVLIGKGAQVYKDGGYKSYFEKLKQEAEEINKRIKLSDKKLTVDLANAERVYKTYFSTRAMAIIATIVSVALLLIKLAEVFGWLDIPKR
jgi:hypothetical protein